MEVDDSGSDNMTILRNEMLNHLLNNSEIVFKSQQIGEPELSGQEKRNIAEECLSKKPLHFLSRFSQYMDSSHFEYFKRIYPEYDYEINHYIKENSRKSDIVIKNRRLEAMKRLALEGEYFTEDEMMKRNPLLYQHLVGKYLTEEEKKDKNSFSHTMNQDEGYKLSSLLMEQFERDIAADLRKEQENAEEEIETDSDDELEVDEDVKQLDPNLKEKDDRVLHLWGESKKECNYINVNKKISEGEKRLLFEEFRSHMYRDFIGGREPDFDYSKVDSNTDYDDLDEMDRDEQDKYFSTDSPEDDEMEVCKSGFEVSKSKFEFENKAIMKNNCIVPVEVVTDDSISSDTQQSIIQFDTTDPLDAYMCLLNKEQTEHDLNIKMKNANI